MARPRPLEIELKYRVVDAAAGDAYLAADDVAGFRPSSPVRSTQVEDRYIDTADGAMARAGFAARLRQTAKGTTVAVKSAVRRVGTGNVHRREELEGPADRTAHPRDWPPSDARSVLLEQCGDAPLVELVTIRQLRRKRILERNGTAVELSLDEVDAVTRSRVVGRFVELEVELMAHPDVAEAAVIAKPDERWSERPLACVVTEEGASVSAEELCEHLADRVAKFWIPDEFAFIDEVPKTSVGKFDKKVLRKQLEAGELDAVRESAPVSRPA